jgi:hypothetical protein
MDRGARVRAQFGTQVLESHFVDANQRVDETICVRDIHTRDFVLVFRDWIELEMARMSSQTVKIIGPGRHTTLSDCSAFPHRT